MCKESLYFAPMPIKTGTRPLDSYVHAVVYTSLGSGFKVVPQLTGNGTVSRNFSPGFGPPYHVDTGPHGSTNARDGRKQQDLADFGIGNAISGNIF